MSDVNPKGSSRAAMMVFFFLIVGLIGIFGAATLWGTGLTSSENYSDFQKVLIKWDENPEKRYLVISYIIVCFVFMICGVLGIIASLMNWFVNKIKE